MQTRQIWQQFTIAPAARRLFVPLVLLAFSRTLLAAAPTITSVSPVYGYAGTTVTIVGTNFGSTQGTSTVQFNGVTASVSSWSATSIKAIAPANGTGNIVVTVGGIASNGVSFVVRGRIR